MSSRILDDIAEEARKGSFGTGEDQESVIRGIELLKRQKLNVAFVGATGVGKSSTINAIFNMDVAARIQRPRQSRSMNLTTGSSGIPRASGTTLRRTDSMPLRLPAF